MTRMKQQHGHTHTNRHTLTLVRWIVRSFARSQAGPLSIHTDLARERIRAATCSRAQCPPSHATETKRPLLQRRPYEPRDPFGRPSPMSTTTPPRPSAGGAHAPASASLRPRWHPAAHEEHPRRPRSRRVPRLPCRHAGEVPHRLHPSPPRDPHGPESHAAAALHSCFLRFKCMRGAAASRCPPRPARGGNSSSTRSLGAARSGPSPVKPCPGSDGRATRRKGDLGRKQAMGRQPGGRVTSDDGRATRQSSCAGVQLRREHVQGALCKSGPKRA